MCRCPVVVLLVFLRFCLIIFSMRPGQVFRKPFFISMRRLAIVGLKSESWMYYAISGLVVWSIILFVTDSDCCVSRGTYQIPVWFFLVPLIMSCIFFWTDISWLYSVMVHPSSHNTPYNIIWTLLFYGKVWICLACLIIPGSWSVSMCDDSIVIPPGCLAVISFQIIKGAIVVVNYFARCIFAPDSAIDIVLFPGEFGGVRINLLN